MRVWKVEVEKFFTGGGSAMGGFMYGPRFCFSTDLLLEDVRVSKLRRRLGDGGMFCLMKLWTWAVRFRPDGVLTELDGEDIEQIAEHTSRMTGSAVDGQVPGEFINALKECGFVFRDVPGRYVLADFKNGNIVVEKNP